MKTKHICAANRACREIDCIHRTPHYPDCACDTDVSVKCSEKYKVEARCVPIRVDAKKRKNKK